MAAGDAATLQMEIRDQVRGILPECGSVRIVCPACGGGSGREKSMAVSDTGYKGVAFYCFRDRCRARGYLHGPVTYGTREKKSNPKLESLTIENLPDEYYQYLPVKDTSIPPRWEPKQQMVLYPVLSYLGSELGYVKRLYRPLNKWWTGPKALNVINDSRSSTPFLHFPLLTKQNFCGSLVIVEDWPSSEAVAKYAPSCALLGTNLSDSDVGYLLSIGVTRLRICLDNDALASAARMKRAMGLIFDQVDVVFVDKDPKDMSDTELREKFL